MYRVLVSGDRDWGNERVYPKTFKKDIAKIGEDLKAYKEAYGSELLLIHGAARGADSWAQYWADRLGIPVESYPAYWGCDEYEKDTGIPCKIDGEHAVVHGRPAGAIRNRRMYVEGKPNVVLAYHHNIAVSKGTKDMIGFAKKGGTEVILYE